MESTLPEGQCKTTKNGCLDQDDRGQQPQDFSHHGKARVATMTTAIDLAPDIEHRLDVLAARTGRSKALCLQDIIQQGIADMEDYYLAADVRERVRKVEEPVFSAAEARSHLGLDD